MTPECGRYASERGGYAVQPVGIDVLLHELSDRLKVWVCA
jgi:hypothetical protein